MTAAPELAVVVPVLNEAGYIEACLQSLLPQAAAAGAIIVVMDGGSTDGTLDILNRMAEAAPILQVRNNPGRLQSAALNLAARSLPESVRLLLRADAHAVYPKDFILRCREAQRVHAVASVVVPMRNVGVTGLQRAIAAAQSSRLGNGGAAHRHGARSGFVEHGHHALFDRDVFRSLGGYDESFSHNEDAEFDMRARAAGVRIWMCAEAPVTYFPRRSLRALARQYVRHGAGRARTLRRHRTWPRLRQMAAPAALALNTLCLALLPFDARFGGLPLLYAGACGAVGLRAALKCRDPWLLAASPALTVMHAAWGAGFLWTAFTEAIGAERRGARRHANGAEAVRGRA